MNSCIVICFSLLLIAISFPTSDSKSDSVRICVPANPTQKGSHTVKNCEQLARSKKTHATCVFAADRLECLRLVSDKKADMTVLEAEDLVFAADCGTECGVLVVSEVRVLKKNPFEYQAGVIVRTDAHVRPYLKGARLCHPGWTRQDGHSTLFTQYLEDRVAPQSCNANLSLHEDRIRTSAAYFGPSCKAGMWSTDRDEDARLKATYPSLCAACDDTKSCSSADKYWGDGGAATCLKDGAGDALWATFADIKLHFQTVLSSDESSNYRFFCLDGSSQPLNTTEPCVWLARPWQVVVANSKVSTDVQKALELLSDDNLTDWEESLLSVFEAHKEYIVNIEEAKPPADYLDTIPGYVGASEMMLPNCNPRHQVSWCTTTSMEQRKCLWISNAAKSFSVAPLITCTQQSSMHDCLKSVSQKEANFVAVPADYQPEAILRHNLRTFAYEDFKTADGAYTLIGVAKRKSPVENMHNLRSQRVCVTIHDGLAWRSILVALRAANAVSSSCGLTNILQGYFKDICVMEKMEGDVPLCCGGLKDSDPDTAALHCLANNGCDVAFISNSTLYRSTGGRSSAPWASDLKESDFKVICRSDRAGECAWVWAAPSAIMIASDLSQVRLEETKLVLSELSRLFLRRNKSKSPAMSMFGPFFDENNIIFQDTSSDLTPVDRFMEKRLAARSAQSVVNATRYCSKASAMRHNLKFILTLIVSCILYV